MSTVESFAPSPMFFTDAAARRVKALISEENNPALKLRVYVTGGGCSGFQYGFDLNDQLAEDDTVIDNADVSLVIDSLSYQYLVGSTVDFEEGLAGARFIIRNPNAQSTCGCGASFSV
ncbi:iron-sulfur cluster insertion protein ErpA [Salinicola halophilus]|uniref:iron-sulfur cluster insertion protein ErpA n=1 Tax=Salinicola halophilus TaxID=184065 RepID=UPI000DA1F6AF|nr:iron-sulfur cluster insertion protein ErpA [Salinicola halophilus]